jgi:predicted transcriptional regulator
MATKGKRKTTSKRKGKVRRGRPLGSKNKPKRMGATAAAPAIESGFPAGAAASLDILPAANRPGTDAQRTEAANAATKAVQSMLESGKIAANQYKETYNSVFATIYGSMVGVNGNGAAVAPVTVGPALSERGFVLRDKTNPAIDPKESVRRDSIVCLHDGKAFKSLKRHLKTMYGQTPDEYRVAFGLPADYPMTAPNYSKARSAIAKKLGLGKKKGRGRNGK